MSDGVNKSLPQYARPVFVRLVKNFHMTGTYKLKKTELQEEGFDMTKIEDEVYMMGPRDKEYCKLDREKYKHLVENIASSTL